MLFEYLLNGLIDTLGGILSIVDQRDRGRTCPQPAGQLHITPTLQNHSINRISQKSTFRTSTQRPDHTLSVLGVPLRESNTDFTHNQGRNVSVYTWHRRNITMLGRPISPQPYNRSVPHRPQAGAGRSLSGHVGAGANRWQRHQPHCCRRATAHGHRWFPPRAVGLACAGIMWYII